MWYNDCFLQIRREGFSTRNQVHAVVDYPIPPPYNFSGSYGFDAFSTMIKLIVNGQPQQVPVPHQAGQAEASVQNGEGAGANLNVAQLLEHMGLQGKRIAVERNGEIIPRSHFEQPLLADGDQLEIVVAVGGG